MVVEDAGADEEVVVVAEAVVVVAVVVVLAAGGAFGLGGTAATSLGTAALEGTLRELETIVPEEAVREMSVRECYLRGTMI